jgi:hypothetical protein
MEPEYIPDFIESKERLAELVTPDSGELVILIGAVDNNKSRRLCHEVFCEAKDLIYIDSGNGEFSGQVVCGIRRDGVALFPPVGEIYPDVLEETDKFPSELSCAEASVSAPQAITANITAAAIVVDIVYNIAVLGESNIRSVSFSTKSVNVRPDVETIQRRPAA